MLNNLGSL